MAKKPQSQQSIVLEVERDLKKNMRAINTLLNANPDLARLVLINPILVLEDLGIQISTPVKQHITQSLRFPAKLVARRDELAKEVTEEFARLKIHLKLPLTTAQRAKLVYETLKIKPLHKHSADFEHLDPNQFREYIHKHPLIFKVAEYERFRKGGLVFFPRHIYEEYKSGVRQLHWVNAVRFKT
jgi:hypothetical protein